MKNFKSIALALVVVLSTISVSAQTKKVDASKSSIVWTGKKVTGAHEGTINLKDGNLIFKGKTLVGGTFNVDMTSMTVTDLKAGQGKEKLEGNLKADDFFGTDKHETATLVFKKVTVKSPNVYTVNGDLTIKGIAKPVTFDLATTANSATTKVIVDRTKYDIKYNSGNFFENLGDKVIYDDFDLAVVLKF
jgi:polyisoprenoid-binding protein YceI